MLHLRKGRFPKGVCNKLKYKKIYPYRIMKKVYNNTYELDLTETLNISPIFNVVDLYKLHEGEKEDEVSTMEYLKK